jgi:hypothetical protein
LYPVVKLLTVRPLKITMMKKVSLFLFSLMLLALSYSCTKDDTDDPAELTGEQSPMGAVGVTVSSSSAEIAGVKDFSASVTGLNKGISSYSAKATVTNALFKNMVANFPGVTINGDTVSITDLQIQQTTEGIKNLTGYTAGVLVKYDATVGDTYPIGNTGKVRTVVSKSTTDDYPYGFLLIKTVQVDMPPTSLKSTGISKFTFVANHKFGLVGLKVAFDDQSSVTFPVYSSAEN